MGRSPAPQSKKQVWRSTQVIRSACLSPKQRCKSCRSPTQDWRENPCWYIFIDDSRCISTRVYVDIYETYITYLLLIPTYTWNRKVLYIHYLSQIPTYLTYMLSFYLPVCKLTCKVPTLYLREKGWKMKNWIWN